MDEAAAGERDQISLLLEPHGQRERPFPRPPDLEHRLAGEDDAAVDEADDERRELGRRSPPPSPRRGARGLLATRPAWTSMWPWA